jgi:glutathione synthase/RimK-type ligase-like ATP-grasp enzyme
MKRNIILGGAGGRPSMLALFGALNTKEVSLVTRLRQKEGFARVTDRGVKKGQIVRIDKLGIKNAAVVRWGNRTNINMQNCVVYNKGEAIGNASNKKLTRELLKKAEVLIPKMVTPQNIAKEDYPIIARPSYHEKGQNFVILKTPEEFKSHYGKNASRGWYYSQFIPKNREIRIHCAHGKVLAVSEKAKPKDPKQVVWNFDVVGEPWKTVPWGEYVAVWCQRALKAVQTLGLDFGAVDLIIKDKTAYVLEVNTSSGIAESEYMTKRYQLYFDWLFRQPKRREHWDYTKLTSGQSLAWKNYQLLETKPTADEK